MAPSTDRAVQRAIAAVILERGPIGFDEYMEMALYGPGGYYEHPPVGRDGDFVTGPHIHPIFGELLAQAVRELWHLLGEPDPLRLTEVGAGDGTLATQLLEHLQDLPVDYTAAERSAGALRSLAAKTGVQPATDLPTGQHVILANELLDNLPFRRVRREPDSLVEVRVGLDDGHLVEVLAPVDDAAGPIGDDLDVGDETVIPDGALAFVDALAGLLTHGYALLIDYGSEGGPGGITHGYRGHRVLEDLLDRPGTADLTAGVDFAATAARARAAGSQAFPVVTQRQALTALGFETWTRAELERQHELLDAKDGMGAVRAWSARSRSTLLVDPAALGRFRWLMLASPGLPLPGWLAAASGSS